MPTPIDHEGQPVAATYVGDPDLPATLIGQQYLLLRPTGPVADFCVETQATVLTALARPLPHPHSGHITLRGLHEPNRVADVRDHIKERAFRQRAIDVVVDAIDGFPAVHLRSKRYGACAHAQRAGRHGTSKRTDAARRRGNTGRPERRVGEPACSNKSGRGDGTSRRRRFGCGGPWVPRSRRRSRPRGRHRTNAPVWCGVRVATWRRPTGTYQCVARSRRGSRAG